MSFHSNHESLLLRFFILDKSSSKYFWIGLRKNDNGEYKWVDGSNLNFSKWEINQPEIHAGKSCVVMNLNMNWGTDKCSEGFSFICQIEKMAHVSSNISTIVKNSTQRTSTQGTSTQRTSTQWTSTQRISRETKSTERQSTERTSTEINSAERNKFLMNVIILMQLLLLSLF